MTIRLVYTAIFWINAFPRKQGVSDTMSLRLIVNGRHTNMKHAQYQFGQCFQMHEKSKNDNSERTLDKLYAGPLVNDHGGFCAINLKTGREIKRTRATIIPTTPAIIARVHWLAAQDKMQKGLQFCDQDGEIVAIQDLDYPDNDAIANDGDEDDTSDSDTDFIIDDDDTGSNSDSSSAHLNSERFDNYYDAIQNDSGDDYGADTSDGEDSNSSQEEESDAPVITTESEQYYTDNDVDEADDDDTPPPLTNGYDSDSDDEFDDGDEETEEVAENEKVLENEEVGVNNEEPPQRHAAKYIHPVTGERQIRYTRGWAGAMAALEHVDSIRQFTSGHATKNGLIDYIQKDSDDHQTFYKFVNHMLFTQYGIKKGLEIFEQEGEAAVLKELQQMHDLEVVEPLDPLLVTAEMKEKALNYLMFLKRKRSGVVKGQGCADGRKQKAYVKKEDAAAPTVSLPALFLSCLQDAIEHRVVATTDIPGAFLQTDQPEDDEVIIRFDGPMVEALAQIDPTVY